jgi:hypothetical protein
MMNPPLPPPPGDETVGTTERDVERNVEEDFEPETVGEGPREGIPVSVGMT